MYHIIQYFFFNIVIENGNYSTLIHIYYGKTNVMKYMVKFVKIVK